MSSILDNLTEPQKQAVQHISGPMLVIAGAGSGKTRVVTRRIAYLVEQGISDYQILALTFTNKAAREMARRVEQLVGPARSLVTTFHSACARWLRYDIERFDCGRTRGFTIYDTADQVSVIKICLKELNLDPKSWNPKDIQGSISRNKTAMTDCEEALTSATGMRQEVFAKVYTAYEKRLCEFNAVDFDDLLWLALRMFKSNAGLLHEYQSRYRHILVDEYQDTNRLQYLLLKHLVGTNFNIHATGDPDQSIYSWRGANYQNIMDFAADYKNTCIVMLKQNYRSTARILKVSNFLIKNNENRYEKELFTEEGPGDLVQLCYVADERSEAGWVAQTVVKLRSLGMPLNDMAIFYRVNAQSRPLEEAFLTCSLPYSIVGGVRFYERKEIKDFLAYLRVMVNHRDDIAFRRMVSIPARGIGAKTLDKMQACAQQQSQGMLEFLLRPDFGTLWSGKLTKKLKEFRSFCQLLFAIPHTPLPNTLTQILGLSGLKEYFKSKEDAGLADRSENVEALVNRAAEFSQMKPEADLAAFLEDIALVADIDSWDNKSEKLTLMTIHSAKGLEFKVVFVVGLEEGLLPHKNSMNSPEKVEEERRLLYVAMTRAERKLFLSCARQRMQWGRIDLALPSSFLAELPDSEIEEICEKGMGTPYAMSPPMGGSDFFEKKTSGWQKKSSFSGSKQEKQRNFAEKTEDFLDFDSDFMAEDEIQEHPDYE